MSGGAYSCAGDRHDPGREGWLDYYALEDPIDRYDPSHDLHQEDPEDSSNSHDDDLDDRQGSSREARDE